MSFQDEITYLGLDFSTQQLKGIIIDENLSVLHEEQVQFDSALPEFRTHKGVIYNEKSKTVTAPTIMWVKALDILMDKLQISGADFGKVVAVSGSGQQHGTVYWQKGAEKALQNLDHSNFLHTQLASCFSINESPVWMDSSTTEYCKRLEDSVGGPEKLAEITGSKAYERFSGPQIAKIAEMKPVAYENTERISLVSSFACSLFLGKYSPIDFSDGSGMNLLDIRTKQWSAQCLQACAPDLGDKLGVPVPCATDLGTISEYFVERFGFNPACRVISFTGDNPASLVGLCLGPNDVGVSLGTSDTIFLWLPKPVTFLEGHVFVNPIDPDMHMGLLCFKNGSLPRERIRERFANNSCSKFDQMLNNSPYGNYGHIGLYYDLPEIIPQIQGQYHFDNENRLIISFPSAEMEVRGIIEGQFIAKRAYIEQLGFVLNENTKILATGGASNSLAILQVLSDVFNTPVYKQDISNSASLGSAYLACYGYHLSKNKTNRENRSNIFQRIMKSAVSSKLACSPHQYTNEIYTDMVNRYKELVKTL